MWIPLLSPSSCLAILLLLTLDFRVSRNFSEAKTLQCFSAVPFEGSVGEVAVYILSQLIVSCLLSQIPQLAEKEVNRFPCLHRKCHSVHLGCSTRSRRGSLPDYY